MTKLRLTLVLGLCSIRFVLAQLPPLEQKIVGVWQFNGVDSTGRVVIRADHSCETLVPATRGRGWEILAKGTWRIEGHDLVRVEKPASGPAVPAGPSVTSKLPIRSVTPDKFQLGAGPAMKRVK